MLVSSEGLVTAVTGQADRGVTACLAAQKKSRNTREIPEGLVEYGECVPRHASRVIREPQHRVLEPRRAGYGPRGGCLVIGRVLVEGDGEGPQALVGEPRREEPDQGRVDPSREEDAHRDVGHELPADGVRQRRENDLPGLIQVPHLRARRPGGA